MTTRNEPCAIAAEKLILTRKNRPNAATQFGRRFRELGSSITFFWNPEVQALMIERPCGSGQIEAEVTDAPCTC